MRVTQTVLDAPVVGRVIFTTRALALVDVHQVGTRLRLRRRLCQMRVRSDSETLRMAVPQAFVRGIGVDLRDAELTHQEGAWWLQSPRHTALRGMGADSAIDEALPVDPADARVVDADEDGKPGLTLRLDGLIKGEIYVVQRDWSRFQGRLSASDWIRGRVQWGFERQVLDASNPLLTQSPEMAPAPDAAAHTFRMRRLSGAWTCPRLNREARDLFIEPVRSVDERHPAR